MMQRDPHRCLCCNPRLSLTGSAPSRFPLNQDSPPRSPPFVGHHLSAGAVVQGEEGHIWEPVQRWLLPQSCRLSRGSIHRQPGMYRPSRPSSVAIGRVFWVHRARWQCGQEEPAVGGDYVLVL
ncbi:hypothetical protein M413DRAFT_154262 [Hebeloma cylindrosporum]|uniref:Uncharacterized protein n=1 Tax=Hebeloma cylindrosporum TaxID=76867 RepID=A0A0C3C9C8_HEBCY|nr:hypothetical protein M413DRAFT_154262 [Hebeloma cylindrosporum h7]